MSNKGITISATFQGGTSQSEIILDEVCPACGGVGLPSCSECEGVGSIPTENGLQLLQFLRRYNAQFRAEEV